MPCKEAFIFSLHSLLNKWIFYSNLIDDEKEKNWRKKGNSEFKVEDFHTYCILRFTLPCYIWPHLKALDDKGSLPYLKLFRFLLVPRSVLENDWKRVTNYLLPTHDEISLKYADLFLYTNVEQCGNEGVCKRQITVLHKAVRNGDINTMKILVRQNRSILNQADEFGWVPLHFASVLNRLDAVSWLLNQPGIDTDKRNNFGNMPDDDDFLRWPWFDYSVIKTLIREHRRKSRQRRITL